MSEITKTQKIGMAVVIGGSLTCLLLAVAWIINAMYWQHLTGNWLDHHITDYEIAPIICILGVVFFTRVVARLFDV